MTGRQNHGMYATSRRDSIARWMARAARRGELARGFPGRCAVIGVSTKPGFRVTTLTPAA